MLEAFMNVRERQPQLSHVLQDVVTGHQPINIRRAASLELPYGGGAEEGNTTLMEISGEGDGNGSSIDEEIVMCYQGPYKPC